VLQFGEALNQIDPLEGLRKLVDPRLKENYPIEDVLKVRSIYIRRQFETFLSICVIPKKITCLYA
jgi:hypothetical protein